MFDSLKSSVTSILSNNGIIVYNEFSDIDLVKNFNRNIGFLGIKGFEKINSYQNSFELKSNEVFITMECKIIAKKGMTAAMLSDSIDSIYEDFMLSEDALPVSLKMSELKINSLYSRLETTITMKFRYYLIEDYN